MIIDATNQIMGRIAAFAAKKALLGEHVDIVNCEKAIITGNRKWILEEYRKKIKRGHPYKGPFAWKRADRLLRRVVRGMVPFKQEKGHKAFARVMCHLGLPEQFKGKPFEKVPGADISKVPNLKYISLQELCKSIGAEI